MLSLEEERSGRQTTRRASVNSVDSHPPPGDPTGGIFPWVYSESLMTVLSDLVAALADGRVDVVDLTAPLSERTPILQLPPPFANTQGFALQEISNFDERGPGWYWNNFSAGEHVGTHFDAPVHWISGREGPDVSQVPPKQLVGPAVVIDKSAECASNPDFLLDVSHVEEWQKQYGPLPEGGWLLFRSRCRRRA